MGYDEFIKVALENELRAQADKIFAELADEFSERFRKKLREQTGLAAMTILSHYDVMQHQNRVVITVKNAEDK